MRIITFAIAAALALPLQSPALSQVPAKVDVDSLQPVSGSWSFRTITGGSEAAFTDAAATQRLVIRCNRAARTVSIIRPAVPAAAPTLSIWTSSQSRSLASRYLATKELIADVASADTILDSIAFSRGRFATAAAGAPLVALPVWAEPVRVIEDCRS